MKPQPLCEASLPPTGSNAVTVLVSDVPKVSSSFSESFSMPPEVIRFSPDVFLGPAVKT